MTKPCMIDWALYYAALGLRVLPLHSIVVRDGCQKCACDREDCGSPGKHPIGALVPHGVKNATSDVALLQAWWTTEPDASIGLATEDKFAIVDIDPRNGGTESFAELNAALGDDVLATPWVVETGGGGWHLAFVAPPRSRTRKGIRPGIDLLIESSYVVAPPSPHASGGAYRHVQPFTGTLSLLPSLPGFFLRHHGRVSDASEPRGLVQQGRRNENLTSIAGSLRRNGASVEVILDALRAVNSLAFKEPLTEAEVRRVAESIARKPSQERAVIAFESPSALVKVAPGPEYLIRGYIAVGVVTAMNGPPKVGKTTIELAMVAGVVGARSFLGLEIGNAPVLILTEENPTSLVQALARAHLAERDDKLRVLRRTQVRGARWDEIVESTVAEAKRFGAKLIVVDTLGRWGLVDGLDENSAADATTAIEPLVNAAAEGLAVFVAQHARKSGGDAVASGRGSSAIPGAVDIVVSVQAHGTSRNTRTLDASSRFAETPSRLVVEYRDGTFVSHEDGKSLYRDSIASAILGCLPDSALAAVAASEIQEALAGTYTLSRERVREHLRELVASGVVREVVSPVRSVAHRFWLPPRLA